MTSPTTDKVKLGSTNRSQADKLSDFYTSKDFGGASNGVTDDTVAINAGIAALVTAFAGGVLFLPPNTVYIESSLVLNANVTVVELHKSGKIKYLIADDGYVLPVTKGGIEIKTQGKDGVLLSSHDSGVSGFPYLRILESITGQLAALYALNLLADGYIELKESAGVPNAPAVNKARLFLVHDGAGHTQLGVRFNTGTVQYLATQTMEASAVYDPPNLADGEGVTTTVVVNGAALGDYVECSFSLDLQGITVTAYVSAVDTVSVRFQNESGGALDLASGTLKVRVNK